LKRHEVLRCAQDDRKDALAQHNLGTQAELARLRLEPTRRVDHALYHSVILSAAKDLMAIANSVPVETP